MVNCPGIGLLPVERGLGDEPREQGHAGTHGFVGFRRSLPEVTEPRQRPYARAQTFLEWVPRSRVVGQQVPRDFGPMQQALGFGPLRLSGFLATLEIANQPEHHSQCDAEQQRVRLF